MWLTIILSIIALNISLVIIHHVGPKAIMLTWIPSRSIVLVLSMIHQKELIQWLQISWAASSCPVAFLAVFHFTLRALQTGRLPRFSCAHKEWILCWITALIVTVCTTMLVYYTNNSYAYLSIGLAAALLNIVNVTDAPAQLQQQHLKFTMYYVLFINVLAIGALITIDQLVQLGEVEWAGICSNFPILAAALLAGSTCTTTQQAMRTTTQHVYMLAYQTWPSMAFIGVIWAAEGALGLASIALGSISVIIVLAIQYTMIKNEL